MKIVSFSVTNYRSITTARKIKLSQLTVLVGKNNEGKSNLLKALNLSMDIMTIYAHYADNSVFLQRYIFSRSRNTMYDWERDFPLSLQAVEKVKPTTFDLVFDLSDEELREINSITGMRMGSTVPIRIIIGIDKVSLMIPKRGSSAFKRNQQKIINFVCSKISFKYIPAIRTDQDAMRVINELISQSFRKHTEDSDYIEVLEKLKNKNQEILNDISLQIKEPLSVFLPNINDVKIELDDEFTLKRFNQNIKVLIDDGTLTDIKSKGDGIKSLTTLALLNINRVPNKASVITIEEPESHLHPEAIHSIYETIQELSLENQIILTTHSPLLVNNKNISNNIIVDSGFASSAKSIKEIREVLGVIVSDNLINASYVLFVEGDSDKKILEKVLPELNETVKKALRNRTLVIESINGSGNLLYNLKLHREIQCQYHVLLDDDDAGRAAFEKAEKAKLLTVKQVTFTKKDGAPNSEFEDLLCVDAYKDFINEEFGVNLKSSSFRGNKKWSERISKCFEKQGKPWNNDIECRVKTCIAENIGSGPDEVLNQNLRGPIDALGSALQELIIG